MDHDDELPRITDEALIEGLLALLDELEAVAEAEH